MQSFTELEVWRQAQDLAVLVFEDAKTWPAEQRFGLTSQVQRSASSISANIAEGHGRFGNTEFHRFCNIAHGSLSETHSHLLLAARLGYLDLEHLRIIEEQIVSVRRLLRAFMKHLTSS